MLGHEFSGRARERQLAEYARACEALDSFLTGHGLDAGRFRDLARQARSFQQDGWTDADLSRLGRTVLRTPWLGSKGRDLGAPSPVYADEGGALLGKAAQAALALRAVGPA